MTDEITLTIPRLPRVHSGVAHLVLGGLASRLDLTLEMLEDLELAIDAVLGRVGPADADDGDRPAPVRRRSLETVIGPLAPAVLDEIEREPDGDARPAPRARRRPSTTCTSTATGCA